MVWRTYFFFFFLRSHNQQSKPCAEQKQFGGRPSTPDCEVAYNLREIELSAPRVKTPHASHVLYGLQEPPTGRYLKGACIALKAIYVHISKPPLFLFSTFNKSLCKSLSTKTFVSC